MSSILFCDVDGMLVPAIAGQGQDFSIRCVAQLNRITEQTGAQIVVHSTWRKAGLRKIRETFERWGVRGQIIDITPMDYPISKGGVLIGSSAGDEIARWIEEHSDMRPKTERFAILDDGAIDGWVGEYLFRAESRIGLTLALADHVIAHLKGGATT